MVVRRKRKLPVSHLYFITTILELSAERAMELGPHWLESQTAEP